VVCKIDTPTYFILMLKIRKGDMCCGIILEIVDRNNQVKIV
jgi:hypothetical protein